METTLLWAQTRRCSHDTSAYERLYLRKVPRMTYWLRWVLFGRGAIRRRDVALVSTLANIAFDKAQVSLVAHPRVSTNRHELAAKGTFRHFRLPSTANSSEHSKIIEAIDSDPRSAYTKQNRIGCRGIELQRVWADAWPR